MAGKFGVPKPPRPRGLPSSGVPKRPKKAQFGSANTTLGAPPGMGSTAGLAGPGSLGGAPGASFRHGGGVKGGSMNGYRTTVNSHDCPTLGGASKAATTRNLCRGGRS